MTTPISAAQRRALEQSAGRPIRLVDPERNEQYILMRAEIYERLEATLALDEPASDAEFALFCAWGKSSGWEDPSDSVFDNLEPQR